MQHSELARGRWFTMSLSTQLGNIGSEYERARRWKQQNNPDRLDSALKRMDELFSLTLSDRRWSGRRLREIARLHEQVNEEFFGNERPEQPDLQKYFYYFAVAARR